MKQPAVYIMANQRNGTLYIGVTSDLVKRVWEHKNCITKGFTSKYNCKMLVYYEVLETMESAIMREKQLKNFSRAKKLMLIETINPGWKDLYETII
jgi:putative endonuclease